jgi:hypothetical protein
MAKPKRVRCSNCKGKGVVELPKCEDVKECSRKKKPGMKWDQARGVYVYDCKRRRNGEKLGPPPVGYFYAESACKGDGRVWMFCGGCMGTGKVHLEPK